MDQYTIQSQLVQKIYGYIEQTLAEGKLIISVDYDVHVSWSLTSNRALLDYAVELHETDAAQKFRQSLEDQKNMVPIKELTNTLFSMWKEKYIPEKKLYPAEVHLSIVPNFWIDPRYLVDIEKKSSELATMELQKSTLDDTSSVPHRVLTIHTHCFFKSKTLHVVMKKIYSSKK